MATINFVWELGSGLGHLMRWRPIARELLRRDHTLIASVRDLHASATVLGELPIKVVQCPLQHRPTDRIVPARHYGHLLHNTCFAETDETYLRVRAWQDQWSHFQPDLVVCDHSPTALAALYGENTPVVLCSTGFAIPPANASLPHFLPDDETNPILPQEQDVLERVNQVFDRLGKPPLTNLSQLWAAVAENILATFPEFDHFPNRNQPRYYGVWNDDDRPAAGVSGEFHVFAYLKLSEHLPGVLQVLENLRLNALIFIPEAPPQLRKEFASDTLRFLDVPVHLGAVAASVDLAVLHGGHGATSEFLLGGTPVLLLPLHVEQWLFARQVENLRLGAVAPFDRPQHFSRQLETLLSAPEYRHNASVFADTHQHPESRQTIYEVASLLENLARD